MSLVDIFLLLIIGRRRVKYTIERVAIRLSIPTTICVMKTVLENDARVRKDMKPSAKKYENERLSKLCKFKVNKLSCSKR
jgi:hypothetical protein